KYQDYIEVQSVIRIAFRKLHHEEARKRFGKSLIQLTDTEMKALLQSMPLRLNETDPTAINTQL
ncbi:MAG: hypothetical protein M3Q97_03070, partial [Bacteroidota bacterium]|nr:hypothetical protein [Bacteroidota bacterium]